MITLLTIGQTPREDLMYPFIMEEFKYTLSLKGALDEFTEKEIEDLEKQDVNRPLFVRTRYGTANIGHASIEKELQRLIFNFEKLSEAIVILCTSEFNCQSNETEIILPVLEMKNKMANMDSTKNSNIYSY